MQKTFAQAASDARSFVTRQVAGDTLIVPVTGSMVDLESIYVLNDVGARIWELLRTPTTVAAVAAALAVEFDVEMPAALIDAEAFVAQLADRGLIQPSAGQDTA